MTVKGTLHAAFTRATGYELRRPRTSPRRGRRRPAGTPDRLVARPAFVLCTLRSGSTLLRVILDSHSRLHAPQELHFRYMAVKLTSKWGVKAASALGLDEASLEYLLWDRILHRELVTSGKEHIVCKTPNDVFIADRIVECWPDVRFIFLLRHPAAIAQSRQAARPGADPEKNLKLIRKYCEALEAARTSYPGHIVRYEDLTADPAGVTQAVCTFLDVPWEATMLDYGSFDHGRYRAGLGDWKEKIRAGRIQPSEPLPTPEETPEELRDLAVAWGYAPREAPPARERMEVSRKT